MCIVSNVYEIIAFYLLRALTAQHYLGRTQFVLFVLFGESIYVQIFHNIIWCNKVTERCVRYDDVTNRCKFLCPFYRTKHSQGPVCEKKTSPCIRVFIIRRVICSFFFILLHLSAGIYDNIH